jgi:hypothetical protein
MEKKKNWITILYQYATRENKQMPKYLQINPMCWHASSWNYTLGTNFNPVIYCLFLPDTLCI